MVGTFREDQHQHPAALDRLDDLGAIFDTRPDVTRRDPGAHAGTLQHRAGGVGGRFVAVRIADEDVQPHGGYLRFHDPLASLVHPYSAPANPGPRPLESVKPWCRLMITGWAQPGDVR